MDDSGIERVSGAEEPSRRSALTHLTTGLMAGGIALSYGACAAMGARYLYPAHSRPMRWQFLGREVDFEPGSSTTYRAPGGERIAIARTGSAGTAADFVALSSVCPHLGCQVHWEGHADRFFCPCHNGVFDPEGRAVSGPPAESAQDLPRYGLKLEGGLLYIEVPADSIAQAPDAGHDACLGGGSEEQLA